MLSWADYAANFGGADGSELAHAVWGFFTNGGGEAVVLRLTDMSPGASRAVNLELLDGVDLNLLSLPGSAALGAEAAAAELASAARYCASRRAFLVADCPTALGMGTGLRGWVQALTIQLGEAASYAALYAPSPTFLGPDSQPYSAPPSGAVAGVYARTDRNRGVWKAPAGLEARVTGAVGVAGLSNGEIGLLNSAGVCPIHALPDAGIVLWGARTLAGGGSGLSEWKYVPVRRLSSFIERSIERGLQWAVFEPNAENLWAAIRLIVGSFLNGLFREGAFAGASAREAYFIECGRDTMTQDDIDHGRLIVEVGIAPIKPAEFVIIRIGLWAAKPDP